MRLDHALRFVSVLLAAGIATHAPAQARLFQAPLACDRACLVKTANDYLAALVAHDPRAVRFSPELKLVENAERLKAGEGLWKTASAVPSAFALHVPDPVSGQIGFIGMMEESEVLLAIGMTYYDSISRRAATRRPSPTIASGARTA